MTIWPGISGGRARESIKTRDRTLLQTFSSMFHGKGLPDKERVDAYLAWDIWWQGEGGAQNPEPGAAAELLVDV